MRRKSALVLFTLSPETEGRRKPLGLGRPERAATVYAALLRHMENVCSKLPDVDLLLSTPDQRFTSERARHVPQRGMNFGQSLRLSVEDAFALGYERVVVIGNDAPEITPTYLRAAFERLESRGSCQAVIGPARDGGYTLLGLTQPCARAFENMPWGSRHVADWTEDRLTQSGFEVGRLPVLDDIDNRHGLTHFLTRIRRGELSLLAKEIGALLPTNRMHPVTQTSRAPEILLAHWRGLRAPPQGLPEASV
jgi:hypothetical protein